jgi:hypothetical protein
VYDQFWVQTVRYLTEGRLLGDKRRFLQTDREAYDLGDAVRVSAYLSDESFKPLEAEEEKAVIEDPAGGTIDLTLAKDPSAPGWFRGAFAPRVLGRHKIRLATPNEGGLGGAKPPAPLEKTLNVEAPAVEFESPRLDEDSLKELARLTGGSYTPLAEIAALPRRIPDRRQTVVTTDEPIPLWDNGFVMSVIAGLLAIEWILRKVNRLL